ncbi:MAG TPA: ribonuclease H-like domain-containing protein, partial [Dyella sp.]
WRGVWENCRLATVERQLLQVVREDDLPGAEAPAAWLGFLRGGSAAPLHRVAQHNSQDLRSLGGVLNHLVIDPLAPDGAGTYALG